MYADGTYANIGAIDSDLDMAEKILLSVQRSRIRVLQRIIHVLTGLPTRFRSNMHIENLGNRNSFRSLF